MEIRTTHFDKGLLYREVILRIKANKKIFQLERNLP